MHKFLGKQKITKIDSRRNDSIAMKGIDSTFRNISSNKAPVTRQFYQQGELYKAFKEQIILNSHNVLESQKRDQHILNMKSQQCQYKKRKLWANLTHGFFCKHPKQNTRKVNPKPKITLYGQVYIVP